MIKLAIIGYPLGHSLSPAMHNASLRELGIEGSYIALETPPETLEKRIEFFKNEKFNGFNVTIPHKVEIIKFLDNIDNFVKNVGAVNTVIIDENNKFYGYNTDVYGFVYAIPENLRKNFRGQKAAIIGAGGAARAVLAGLTEMDLQEISILARNIEKSLDLQKMILKNFPHIKINFLLLDDNVDLSDCCIVVNTTPLGMQGKYEDISPLNQDTIATLPKNAFVYDIVYKPQKTKFIEYAENQGLNTLNGLDMLILQGAKSFELWTGQKPSVKIIKNSLFDFL